MITQVVDADDSLNDADNFDDLVNDFSMDDQLDLAYMPC